MNELSMYIKTIITIILIKPIIKCLLPGEKMSKYINFVLGIMIISMMIMPFSHKTTYEIADYSHDFEKMNYEEVNRISVEKEIERNLNEKFNVNDVDVTLDGDMNILSITSQKQNEIREYLGL